MKMKIKRNSRMLAQTKHSTYMKNCSEHNDLQGRNLKKKEKKRKEKKKRNLLHLETVSITEM
jgi:hypothetical protein